LCFFTANNVIKSDRIERIMKSVDRGNYVSMHPYLDQPQSIGYGVTISAPHMVIYNILIWFLLSYKQDLNFITLKIQKYVFKKSYNMH